jgi:hypothetical protein
MADLSTQKMKEKGKNVNADTSYKMNSTIDIEKDEQMKKDVAAKT